MIQEHQPSNAFVLVSWAVLITGISGFLIGLWNAGMGIEEKGYYFTVLSLGLFSAVSIQKSVRDRMEGVEVTDIYYGICWAASVLAVALLSIGLFNATNLVLSEKGFYVMSFVLSMFAAIAVQKNTRDMIQAKRNAPPRFVPEKKVPLHDKVD